MLLIVAGEGILEKHHPHISNFNREEFDVERRAITAEHNIPECRISDRVSDPS